MGIFLGWIVQKRWLTLSAFLLNVVAVFTLPRLPAPYSYLVVVPPAILLSAIVYEGSRLFGLRISSKLRIAWSLWMGVCVLVLMVGVVLSGSNTVALLGSMAAFMLLSMVAITAVALSHARGVRDELNARQRLVGSQSPPTTGHPS